MKKFTTELKKTFSLKDRFIHFKNKYKRRIVRKFRDNDLTVRVNNGRAAKKNKDTDKTADIPH